MTDEISYHIRFLGGSKDGLYAQATHAPPLEVGRVLSVDHEMYILRDDPVNQMLIEDPSRQDVIATYVYWRLNAKGR